MSNNINLKNYFYYLRDISHKIAVSSDWYKCLKQKQKSKKDIIPVQEFSFSSYKSSSYIINKAHSHFNDFENLYSIIKEIHNKSGFLGIGCIYGKKNKQILGSLVNIPLIFQVEENEKINNNKLKEIILDFKNSTLNYDLLLSLVDFVDDTTFDNFKININDFQNNYDINKLITDLIVSLNLFIVKHKLILTENINTLVGKINLITDNHLSYDFSKLYLFSFEIPDNISTWKSLDSFCKNIGNKFNSPVLENLFSNTYIPSHNNIRTNNQYLPMSISKNQEVAINQAFSNPISYIQGPPGTGKSHTITAIAINALLNNKTVLIVSQKNTAIKVVKDKINQYFNSEENTLPFVYFTKENKKELKEKLEKSYSSIKNNSDTLNSLSLKVKLLKKTLDEKILLLNSLQSKVSHNLNKQYLFSTNNETYIANNNKYSDHYNTIIEPLSINNENIHFINKIQNIVNFYENNNKKLSNFYLNLLNKHNIIFNSKFYCSLSFVELLKNEILIDFLKDFFNLSFNLNLLEQEKFNLTQKESLDLTNKKVKTLVLEVESYKKKYFQEKHNFELLSSLSQHKDELQNFAKMLHFQRADLIEQKMKHIDFDSLISTFKLWLSEIRNIGEILPNQSELFDLIIVDEASQVNLAEILPVFYRGKNICIVGDQNQLGLSSVGLNFVVSKKDEEQIWNNYNQAEMSYGSAKDHNLLVTESSILNLLTSKTSERNFPTILLNEHFRSLPQLAKYTNSFYNGDLTIMTETPEKSLVNCFCALKVNGKRENKINIVEAEEVINIVKFLHNILLDTTKYNELNNKIQLNTFYEDKSIGIVALVRDHLEYIKYLLENDTSLNITIDNNKYIYTDENKKEFIIKCGTPEELQGDEFDTVIFSASVDEDTKNAGHYSNPNRINVATSRAKYFTIFVYSEVLKIPTLENYLRNFGIYDENTGLFSKNQFEWTFNEDLMDSHFERIVSTILLNIISKYSTITNDFLRLYNQVPFAKKRIDFVIFNKNNNKSVAIEVDGQFHFKTHHSRVYSEEHNERIDLLTRAGWKIINTPYFLWYENGKIDLNNPLLIKEQERIEQEIIKILDIE